MFLRTPFAMSPGNFSDRLECLFAYMQARDQIHFARIRKAYMDKLRSVVLHSSVSTYQHQDEVGGPSEMSVPIYRNERNNSSERQSNYNLRIPKNGPIKNMKFLGLGIKYSSL